MPQVGEVLPGHQPGERRDHRDVAAPEAARLANEAEEPFQSSVLHPGRRLGERTRVHIERRANADERHCQPVAVGVRPLLLAWAPEPDEDDARAGRADVVHILLVFRRGKRAKRRRAEACHPKARKPPLQGGDEAFEHLDPAPI